MAHVALKTSFTMAVQLDCGSDNAEHEEELRIAQRHNVVEGVLDLACWRGRLTECDRALLALFVFGILVRILGAWHATEDTQMLRSS